MCLARVTGEPEKLRVWSAPEDLRRGEKLHDQIDRAIQVNDRLLVVLSKHSMQSDWVKLETATAYSARRVRRELWRFVVGDSPTRQLGRSSR